MSDFFFPKRIWAFLVLLTAAITVVSTSIMIFSRYGMTKIAHVYDLSADIYSIIIWAALMTVVMYGYHKFHNRMRNAVLQKNVVNIDGMKYIVALILIIPTIIILMIMYKAIGKVAGIEYNVGETVAIFISSAMLSVGSFFYTITGDFAREIERGKSGDCGPVEKL